ncbi:SWIM zinc finger family protein [Clostridium lundense]|uniref:SWIM zinc finger family protein n=1 Tax=Clostridium lundense TaxID=319475 RepID=UPI00047F21A4|nr:SWIM zinc finger family protein [Clostridium lundense]
MDSKDNFLKEIGEILLTIDDELLIGISNKGIFNRAKKDLEKIKDIKVEIEETTLKCILEDGTECVINEDIKSYKCSCPSRTTCKHVIMCYLYLKSNFNSLLGVEKISLNENEEHKKFDFGKLLNIRIENLSKLIGEKSFNEIVKRINFGVEAHIEEASVLTVDFKDEDYLVKFIPSIKEEISPREILEEATCSCKSKDICRHKVEALVQYEIFKGFIRKEELMVLNKKSSSEKKLLMEGVFLVKKLMEELLFVGISRLPKSIIDKIESTAVLCHNYNLPNLEKMLRGIKNEVELYINKNASFSIASLRKRISYTYTTALAIENCKDEVKLYKLCGEHKSTYYDIPQITLYGIGAEAWNSKSGYEGITYYYFEENIGEIFTYTNSRPTYYDTEQRSYKMAYREVPSWGIEGSLDEISQHIIRLNKGKINDERRISSSEQSKGELLEKTDIYKLNFKQIFIDNWQHLLQVFSKQNSNVYIIKIASYGKSSFDNINQRFILPICDKEKNIIYIEIDYSKERKKMIQNFERMERIKKYPDRVLVHAYLKEGEVKVLPIVAYYENGDIVNLTLNKI